VHDGTGHMAGTPFLLAAFEMVRKQLMQDVRALFQ
jgi:hypothetical protein